MANDNETIYKCAECRSPMLIKVNRSNGERFLGCSQYPSCRYTENIDEEDELNGVPDAASVWE